MCLCACVCSVHPFAAVDGSTVTRDLVLVILEVKLIVITQLRGRERGREAGREKGDRKDHLEINSD